MIKNQSICLITGANSGIGFEATKDLVGLGVHVIMWCKNKIKANQAKAKILLQYPRASIHIVIADLASQKQIKEAVNNLIYQYDHIDILINNAACLSSVYETTDEHLELQWAVNYFAPFLLTGLLLPLIKKSKQGRIINVSSRAHIIEEIKFEAILNSKKYSGKKAYGSSKLALILFTNYLSSLLKNSKITVNSMYPGLVNTSFGFKNTPFYYRMYWTIAKHFGISAKQGADTIIYLATAPELHQVSGKYFGKRKIKKPSSVAEDFDLAKQLWHYTEKVLNFKPIIE